MEESRDIVCICTSGYDNLALYSPFIYLQNFYSQLLCVGHKTITEPSQETDKRFAHMNKAPDDRFLQALKRVAHFLTRAIRENAKNLLHINGEAFKMTGAWESAQLTPYLNDFTHVFVVARSTTSPTRMRWSFWKHMVCGRV